MQKEIQQLAIKISEKSQIVNTQTNELEIKMKKKDCLDLILGELMFQMNRFNQRWEEVERINIAIAQAQTLAAKKAKMNRISGLKGTMFTGSNVNGSVFAINKYIFTSNNIE